MLRSAVLAHDDVLSRVPQSRKARKSFTELCMLHTSREADWFYGFVVAPGNTTEMLINRSCVHYHGAKSNMATVPSASCEDVLLYVWWLLEKLA